MLLFGLGLFAIRLNCVPFIIIVYTHNIPYVTIHTCMKDFVYAWDTIFEIKSTLSIYYLQDSDLNEMK